MLTVTPLYAGLAAFLFAALSLRVSLVRIRLKVSYGDGDNTQLRKAVRLQGNAAEYLPIGLIVIGLTEAGGAAAWIIHAMGLMLIGGRLLHLYGYGSSPQVALARQAGMTLTYLLIGVGGLSLVVSALL